VSISIDRRDKPFKAKFEHGKFDSRKGQSIHQEESKYKKGFKPYMPHI